MTIKTIQRDGDILPIDIRMKIIHGRFLVRDTQAVTLKAFVRNQTQPATLNNLHVSVQKIDVINIKKHRSINHLGSYLSTAKTNRFVQHSRS